MNKHFSLAVLLAAVALAGLFAEPSKALPYYIGWDPVPGCGGYIVEVKSEAGKEVLREKLKPEVTETDLDLPAGGYAFRIITLNKFQKEANATPWRSFTVLAMAPPKVLTVSGEEAGTGCPVNLTLSAEKMAIKASCWLVSPSGKKIPLTIKRTKKNTYQLKGPELSEPGDYTLVVSNPPDLTVEKHVTFAPVADALAKEKADADTALAKEKADREAAEAKVAQDKADEDAALAKEKADREAAETKAAQDKADADAALAKEKADREAAEAKAAQDKADADAVIAKEKEERTAAKIRDAEEKAEREAREPPQYSGVDAGISVDTLFGDWSGVYESPTLGGFIGGRFYATNNLYPKSGYKLDLSLAARLDFEKCTNDGSTVYIESSLTTLAGTIGPELTASWERVRVRCSIAGGIAWTLLKADSLTQGTTVSESTLDPAFSTALTIEAPITRGLSAGLVNEFIYIKSATAELTWSSSLAVSWTFGRKPNLQ